MALGQAARTLQSAPGLAKKKLSNASTLRLAMSLAQGNVMAEAMLAAPSFAINANADQRNMKALLAMYGSKGHMSAANVTPTGQLLANATRTEQEMNEKALKRAKGIQGRLKSGKGRPEEGPGSPGWPEPQGMGDPGGPTDPFGDPLGGGDSGGGLDGGDPGSSGGWGGDPSGGFDV